MRLATFLLLLLLTGCGPATPPEPTPEQKEAKARREAQEWWKKHHLYLVEDIDWQTGQLRKETGDPEAYIKVVRENLVFQDSASRSYYGILEVHQGWKGAEGKLLVHQVYIEVIPVTSEAYYAYAFSYIHETRPDGTKAVLSKVPEWFDDLSGTWKQQRLNEEEMARHRPK